MKLCFKILFLFFVVLSLRFLDASKDSVFLDGNVYDEVNGLLSSDGKHGEEVGSDVELSGSGPINLTLNNGELIFKVCKDRCSAKSTVCYESVIGLSNRGAAGTCFESSCKVAIEGETDKITFGGDKFSMDGLTGCIISTMNYKFAKAESSDQSSDIESCMPKIVGADKMVKLFVDIEDGCSVIVMNAKIHEPPTTTMSPTKMPPPTQPHPKDSADASSFQDWGYVIIGIALLIVIIFIGFVVYYLYRKRKTSKRIPPNVDQKQPKSTKAKDAKIETPIKKDDDLEAAKVEPKKNQKKEKKTKTIEPKTTEDISAPTVTQPEPAPSKQLPPPNPAACYPVVKRLTPRSMKSAKTNSLDETLKKDKSVMMESESVIF